MKYTKNKATKKGIRIKTERTVTSRTTHKQMVQSGTGKQQEERNELTRNLKGKIMPIKK
jgi:hypothetical protein